jgi:gluconokinase
MVVVVVMGVCGSGKSTVGQALANKLSCRFEDADKYHSTENISKMQNGTPLTDMDRLPWLQSLHRILLNWVKQSSLGILACSALKMSYRNILIGKDTCSEDISEHCVFVVLEGSMELIEKRMKERNEHFMPQQLLKSQLEALEIPSLSTEKCIICDINNTIEYIVDYIVGKLVLNF